MPDVKKQGGYATTATERMEAARTVKQGILTREMCWASIATRWWPSYVMPPRIPQRHYPLVAVIQTPSGTIMYRVRSDEVPLFAHLEQRTNTGEKHEDKLVVLHALAENGWD